MPLETAKQLEGSALFAPRAQQLCWFALWQQAFWPLLF
jgi:hypothetical protein